MHLGVELLAPLACLLGDGRVPRRLAACERQLVALGERCLLGCRERGACSLRLAGGRAALLLGSSDELVRAA